MIRFKTNPNGAGIKTGLDALRAFMADNGDATEVEACEAFLKQHPDYERELKMDHLYVGWPERR